MGDVTLNILIVEDDADTRDNLRDILELDGHHIEEAATATGALDREDWSAYSAILLDRKLPDGTAFDLLPQLKRLAPTANVIILTGYADVGGAIEALRLGAVDYLLKPIDPTDLRARLSRIAEHRQLEEARRESDRFARSVLDSLGAHIAVLDHSGTILAVLGHVVVALAETGRELVEKCRDQHPDLVITDIKMPDMDGIDAAAQIYRDGPIPVILVSAHHDADFIRRAEANHILSYLVKPIKQADLEPAIAIVIRRFEQFQALRQETADLKQALEDRKLIERAKGLLMKKASLDEAEAFRRLQKLASDKNKKLIEIARIILTAEEAYGA